VNNKDSESPQWEKVYRSLDEAKTRLDQASTEEQFQAVGMICRETLISLAQIVYDPTEHAPEGITPSKTDAKRLLDAFLSHKLAGHENEAARRQAKATLDLANALQHKRTAGYRDAAHCVEATTSVVNTAILLSGHTPRTSPFDVQVKFSYRGITLSHDEHLYLLAVLVTNQGVQAVNEFKLEFSFPNLDTIPQKWIVLKEQIQTDKRLLEIKPQDEAVSVREERDLIHITYRSKDTLFPQDQLDLSEAIGLRYRINQDIYANQRDMPPLKWILYADNMQPKRGEVSLEDLNNY
jgi:hypothetical protein